MRFLFHRPDGSVLFRTRRNTLKQKNAALGFLPRAAFSLPIDVQRPRHVKFDIVRMEKLLT